MFSYHQKYLHLKKIPSSNEMMKDYLNEQEGFFIWADEQTNAKGRNGKTFIAEKDKGLYFSLLLKPKSEILPYLSILTAVALFEILSGYEKQISIKWINDLYLNNQKIAGILTEVTTIANTHYATIGIGLNLKKQTNFPNCASLDHVVDPKQLLFQLVHRIMHHYHHFAKDDLLSIYRKHQLLWNKSCYIKEGNKKIFVTPVQINDEGHLLVENADKKILRLTNESIFFT